jgi:serine/threonine-protein kinase
VSGGHALLTDFGIAKATEGSGGEWATATGVSLGTPAYMAPEQASGDRATDHRADIYALGCVLYELLTGQAPYNGPSIQSVVAQHVAAPIPSASVIRPTVPSALDGVIARALAKNPVDRFASVEAFLASLKANVESTGATSPPLRQPRSVAVRRISLTIAGLTVVGAAIYSVATRPALDASLLAVAPFQVLDSQFALWREGMVDVLSRNLDGAGTLRSVPPTLVIRRWTGRADRESAVALGKRTGAAFVVYGALTRSGADSVRLTVEIADVPRAKRLATLEMRDAEERLDRLADSAALSVLRELGREGVAGLARPPSSGTRSFAALKAFLQGEQHYRRNLFDSALVAYREAIRIDSTFAAAYRGAEWSMMEAGLFLDPVAMQYASAAARFNHGLSRRDSLLILADSLLFAVNRAYENRDDARPAIRQVLTMLDRAVTEQADDPVLWYVLGNARFYLGFPFGETPRAREAFERAILLDSAFLPSLGYATGIALADDDVTASRRFLKRWIGLRPTESTPHIINAVLDETRANRTADQRLLDTASISSLAFALMPFMGWSDSNTAALPLSRTILKRKSSGSEFAFGSANIGQLGPAVAVQYLVSRGLLHEAYMAARARPDSAFGWFETRALLSAQLAMLGALPFDSAVAGVSTLPMRDVWRMPELRAWWRFSRDTVSLLTAISLGDSTVAADGGGDQMSWYRLCTLASLAIARGDSARAVELFRQVSDTTYPFTWLDQIQHAELLLAKGDTTAAARLLNRLNDIVSSYATPIDARPLAIRFHVLRARAAAATGDRATAIAEYQRLTRRLSHADEALRPIVDEAAVALKRLAPSR